MAAIVYILFAISTGSLSPDLTALATFATKGACETAAGQISAALAKGGDAKMTLCASSDSLKELTRKNGIAGV